MPLVFLPRKNCASRTLLASKANWGAKVKATTIDKPTSYSAAGIDFNNLVGEAKD